VEASGPRPTRILFCACDRKSSAHKISALRDFQSMSNECGWELRQLPYRAELRQFADEGEPEPELFEMLRRRRKAVFGATKCRVS